MNKQEFLWELSARLQNLPENDRAEALSYWSEMIDDRMEDGTSEEDAVLAIGTLEQISAQILGDTLPLGHAEPEKQKKKLQVWEIVLLILGSPIWLSLLIAAFAVILSVYISVWAVVISLWASAVSVTVSALPIIAYGVLLIVLQGVGSGLLWIGASLILLGIGLFLIALCLLISKALCALTACVFRKKKHNEEKGI